MKRSLSLPSTRETALVVAGTGLIAGTYGLVRLAYGLFLPDISASLPITAATAGYLAAGASASYCLGAAVGFVAAGHPRLLVVAAVLTASGGSVAMSLAADVRTFGAALVLASSGAGLASPALVAVVERGIASARVDAAQSTVNAGTGPGLVAAGLLALVLPDWRAGFVASAVVTAAAGAGVLLLDPGRRSARSARSAAGPGGVRWVLGLRVPATGAILLGAASAVTWTFGRTQVAATGAGGTVTVLAWVALGIGGTATVLSARALGRLRPAGAWMLTTAVVAVATAGLGLAPGPGLAVVACAAFGWAFVAASSALIAWAGADARGHGPAGTSVLFVALVLGQAVGATATGALVEPVGLAGTFVLAAGTAFLASLCGAAGSRDNRLTAERSVAR